MDFLVHHLLRTSAARFPHKEALVCRSERLTYQAAARHTASLATGLPQCGLQRGDRIGIYLGPSVSQALAIFAVSQAGGVFVPIHQILFPDQVAHIARNCAMKGLITTAAKLADLASVLPTIPSLEFLVVVDLIEPPPVRLPVYRFEELCQCAPPEQWRDSAIDKDLAAILYTSGSTGKPKGVMLTHAQILAGASIVSTYLGITAAERILAILPLSFDAGLNQLTTAVQNGGTVVFMNFIFARDIVQALQAERITGLAGVPTLWTLLTQPHSTLHAHEFPHLRYLTNTGGAMPQKALATLRTVLPATKIYLMYGLTEAFRSTYLPPEELDRRPTSIGKAIPDTEILVINDQGHPCRPGEVGELVHRGPTVSLGYWGEPELTAAVLRPHPFAAPELHNNEQVCYSGDLVRMDDEGFLYFVGRRDALIKSAGFRVSPTEVEEVLLRSGQVQHAAVVGIPDEMLGQAIQAFIVPLADARVNAEDLRAFCLQHAPRHLTPKVIEIVADLPQTSSGKVDYPALRRRAGLG